MSYMRMSIFSLVALWIIAYTSWGCQRPTGSNDMFSPIQFIGTAYQEEAIDFAFLPDGYLLITGHSNAPSLGQEQDVVFYLMDKDLRLTQTRTWGKTGADRAGEIRVTEDGSSWMAATLATQDTQEMRLLKLPSNDDTLLTLNWMKHEGPFSQAVDILAGEDGDLIYLGNELDAAGNSQGLVMFKIAPGGKLRWPESRSYRLEGQGLRATHIHEVPGGNGFVIVATTDAEVDTLLGQNLVLIRTDQNGIVINQHTTGTRQSNFPVQLISWPDRKQFILVGYSELENGLNQSFLLTAGWDLSNRQIQTLKPRGFRAQSMIQRNESRWLLGGSYQENLGQDFDIGLIPLDVNLDSELQKADSVTTLGYENDEELVALTPLAGQAGHILILANIYFENGNQMIGLLKTDAHGNLIP